MYTEKLPEPPFIVKMLFEMNSYMVSPKNIIQYCKANLAERVQKKGAKFRTFAIKGVGVSPDIHFFFFHILVF